MQRYIDGMVEVVRHGAKNAAVAARGFLDENRSVLEVPAALLARLDLIGRSFFASEPNGHGVNGTPLHLTTDDMPSDLEQARRECRALLVHMVELVDSPLDELATSDLEEAWEATERLTKKAKVTYFRKRRKALRARNGGLPQSRTQRIEEPRHATH
jgi:hypothetical protein